MTKPRARYTSDLVALDNFAAAIQGIDEHITMQMVEILVELARRPKSTMQQLADATGLALSSISRNLMALGDRHRKGKPGLGLVEKAKDPHEMRREIAWLTPQGEAVINQLLEALANPQIEPGASKAKPKVQESEDTWDATPDLRLFTERRQAQPRLQQAFRSRDTGAIQWRDVPVVVGDESP